MKKIIWASSLCVMLVTALALAIFGNYSENDDSHYDFGEFCAYYKYLGWFSLSDSGTMFPPEANMIYRDGKYYLLSDCHKTGLEIRIPFSSRQPYLFMYSIIEAYVHDKNPASINGEGEIIAYVFAKYIEPKLQNAGWSYEIETFSAFGHEIEERFPEHVYQFRTCFLPDEEQTAHSKAFVHRSIINPKYIHVISFSVD